jgi:hypothetical protein
VYPRARQENLTIRELPDETLVYDQERRTAHCLNTTAALVWRVCDGNTSLEDLARIVARELHIPQENEIVELALEQLARRHLLEEAPRAQRSIDRASRREALRQLLRAAIALPLILTITTRAAAQTLSGGGSSAESDPSPSPSPPVAVNLNVKVSVLSGGNPRPSPAQGNSPCRTKGQSCLASASGQQGTCCPGLTCGGVAQGAGVCN